MMIDYKQSDDNWQTWPWRAFAVLEFVRSGAKFDLEAPKDSSQGSKDS
jgi:hypothetical protein